MTDNPFGTKNDPIVCPVCGDVLECDDPGYHRGRTQGYKPLPFVWGRWKIANHLSTDWLIVVSEKRQQVAFVCSREHADEWEGD